MTLFGGSEAKDVEGGCKTPLSLLREALLSNEEFFHIFLDVARLALLAPISCNGAIELR